LKTQSPRNDNLRHQLLREMKEGLYARADRLPRESVLSEKLGISRTQLRDTLASLEREGFITRLQGVGTVINHHVLEVATRMDIEVEFMDMVRQSGHEPEVAFVEVTEDAADEKVAEHLKIRVDTPVIHVTRLITADGKPAIYCEDIIEKALSRGKAAQSDYKLPIFHFLKEFCDTVPYMDLTDVHPVAADAKLGEVLHVPVGAPLLAMDEVDYDVTGVPVLYSKEYYVDGIIRHTVMRKKL
jgi:GntR family transcriptional regulator